MAQNTRLTAYGEQTVESPGEAAGGGEFIEYAPTPSMAKRDYFLPEDIPLFLSNDAAEPRQRGFGNGGESDFDKADIRSQYIKASLLVASAAAIAVAILSVENPVALFANAKASLIGVQASASPKAASAPAIAAPTTTAQPAPAAPSAVNLAALPQSEQAAPTRDEIALALRAAHQRQMETRQPAIEAPPVRRLDADELATLLKRARGLIAIGDIAAARLLLERAADAQEASAALLLGQTFDPAVLGTPDARSITPDPAKARDWYRKAARFGSQDAQLRLSQMQN
jgi:TPR repeat protein